MTLTACSTSLASIQQFPGLQRILMDVDVVNGREMIDESPGGRCEAPAKRSGWLSTL